MWHEASCIISGKRISLMWLFTAVQPDPPQELTWTLLNQSVTSSYSDIMLSWKPPESADVEMGWLRLLYEVQYRNMDIEQWQVVSNSLLTKKNPEKVVSIGALQHYSFHHRLTLWKAPLVLSMDWNQTWIMKSESAAKLLVVKPLGNLVILSLSTSRPKVKTHCSLESVAL